MWSLAAAERHGAAREAPTSAAHARVQTLRSDREPWQRADETLAHYPDARGLLSEDGAAVFRVAGGGVQLLQLVGEAEPLLSALRRLGPVSVLNLPAHDPAAAALRTLGGTVVVRQHEMLLDLAASIEH